MRRNDDRGKVPKPSPLQKNFIGREAHRNPPLDDMDVDLERPRIFYPWGVHGPFGVERNPADRYSYNYRSNDRRVQDYYSLDPFDRDLLRDYENEWREFEENPDLSKFSQYELDTQDQAPDDDDFHARMNYEYVQPGYFTMRDDFSYIPSHSSSYPQLYGGTGSYPGAYGYQEQSNERSETKIRRFFGFASAFHRSDARIREDICDRLMQQGDYDPSNVHVTVQNGELTLKGSVESYRAKRVFEDIAATVLGVREINNLLKSWRS